MSIELHQRFKELFDKVKPIRGRATEVRPFGERRRDWEEVIKRAQPDGTNAYGAKMHSTDVVLVFANGDIQFNCGGWATPTTAAFMGNLIHGMNVYKRYNKLWLQRQVGTEKFIALLDKPVMVRWDTTNPNYEHYRLDAPSIAKQKIMDPAKTKIARAPVKGFIAYVRLMMKIMDGWVTHGVNMQYIERKDKSVAYVPSYWHDKFMLEGKDISVRDMNNLSHMGEKDREHLFDCICSTDEERNLENFPKIMVMFTTGMAYLESQGPWDAQDRKFEVSSLTNKIDRFALSMSDDIHKYKEVVLTKPIPNLL